MKKLFLIILILASNLFSQGWNEIKTTTISEPEKHDIFANSSGIHILSRYGNGNVIYYKLNSDGTVNKTITLEANGDFPNIVGTNDKIYAIYKTVDNNNNPVIRVKYSVDNGSNWLNNIEDRLTTANYCNGVDAVYNDQGVHIVYATQDGGASGFETYYRRLAPDNSWPEYKNVTDDNVAQYGGNPCITVSPNRVHVSFNTDPTTSMVEPGDVKTRDKFNGNWQTPQPVVSVSEQSKDERLLVRGAYLYLFYNCSNSNDLKYKTRPVASTSWSDYPPIESGLVWYYEDAFEITKTTNDDIQVIYKMHVAGTGWVFAHTYYNGTSWSTPTIFDYNSNVRPIGLSSTSNDFFLTWVKIGTPYLRFRQWDAAPLAPQNLTAQATTDYHPKLIWNNNTEADIQKYYVYRSTYNGGYTTPIATLTHNNTTTTQYYIDDAITVPRPGGEAGAKYFYVVSAVDISQYVSGYSNYVEVTSAYLYSEKIVAGNLPVTVDYFLNQNYPNPFNPSTKILFSIKEEGLVMLKVYDILGKEIATLVNENKPAGNYEVEFIASTLPSGMYIYKIQSGSFSDVKKMLLTK
jgi:hypothetical protein